MSWEITDYKLRQIAAHESSILLIKEFIEQYKRPVKIERSREGYILIQCILIQTAVGRLDETSYSNTVGMDYPVKEGTGYLYVNPLFYEGKSVSEKVRDFILYKLPILHTQIARENTLTSLFHDDCGNCIKDT